jgi:hypothetical protein
MRNFFQVCDHTKICKLAESVDDIIEKFISYMQMLEKLNLRL